MTSLRCETLLASLADAVIVTDETGHIGFMNTAAEMIIGQPANKCLHKQLSETFNILSGVHRKPLDDLVARVFKEGVVADLTNTILVRKDGNEIPIDGNGSRIQLEDGSLAGVVFVFRDITKHRQADEALRNQAALLNFAHDAIFVFNTEDTITFWNRGAEEMYGWGSEEAVNRNVHDLLKTRYPTPLAEIKKEAENSGEWNGELIHTRKDGKEIVVASRWAVQWDIWGRHVATLEINRDISERKEAEETLRFERERQQIILDNMNSGVILLDKKGTLLTFNKTVLGWYGYSSESEMWKHSSDYINEFELRDSYDNVIPFEMWPASRAVNEEYVKDLEVKLIRKSTGSSRWISFSTSPIPGYSGEVIHILMSLVDITERKETDQLLRKALEKAESGDRMLSAIIENVPEGISISDTEGNIHIVSRYGQGLLVGLHGGMTIGEVVRNWTVYRPDGQSVMPVDELPLVRALRGETVRNVELLEENLEGRKLPLLCNAAPIRQANGKVVHGIVVWRDITELKKAEQSLRESERNLEQAQHIAHVGSWIWNVATGEVFCSAETFRIYGDEPFSFQPTINDFFKYVHPEDREHLRSTIDDLQSGRIQRMDQVFRIVRKDQSIRYIHSIGETMESDSTGKPHLLRGTGQDITERKLAEEALKESEARLRLAQQVAQIGTFEYDIVNDISRWSPEMETLHGLRPGEYSGNYEQWRSFVYQEDLPEVDKLLSESMVTGHFETEWRIVRSDGTIRWMAVRGQVFRNDMGKPVRMVGVNFDITERKLTEESLQRRTRELAAANRDLESFSYSVSHDLRNPLHTIGSFVDFLLEDHADRLDDEGQDYLRRIYSGVKKMQTLTDDMLSLSRIGRQEMKREDIDLSAIIRNYLTELVNAEPQRKTEIVVQDNVHASADPRLIHLALENMLRNAWKFTSKQEITRIEFGTVPSTMLRHRLSDSQRLSSETRQRPSETGVRWPSEVETQSVYFIRDNGAGFDMQFAQKIFEPFKRVHAEKEFGGTGVGLSIVQRVIGRHGGKVWAEGEVEKGATFYFTLG